MLQLSEVMKAVAEAGKAINEVGASTSKTRSESPDLFRKSGSVEGLKNIEGQLPSMTDYPSNFEKQSAAKLETYSQTGLKGEFVNGRKALIRTDIDMNRRDEFGLTKLERMRNVHQEVLWSTKNSKVISLILHERCWASLCWISY